MVTLHEKHQSNMVPVRYLGASVFGVNVAPGHATSYEVNSKVRYLQDRPEMKCSRDNLEIYNLHALPLTERKNDGDSMNNELQCRIIDLGSNVTGQVGQSFNTETSHINVASSENVLVFKEVRFQLEEA